MKQQGRDVAEAVLKALLFCVLFTGIFVLLSFFKSGVPPHLERFAHGIIGTLAALIATAVFVRLDRKSFRDVGLQLEKTTLQKFLLGVTVGLGIAITMFACLIVFGKLRLQVQHPFAVSSFLLWTLAFIPLAFMEEVAFRAYPLIMLKRKTGIWTSLLVSTTLFALYHVANGWSILLSILGPGVWGLVYGLAAFYSKGIAMPTGIHYAANLTQASIGMSTGFAPLWTMQPQDEMASSESAELIGISIQLTLLLVTLVCIEWYRRKIARSVSKHH